MNKVFEDFIKGFKPEFGNENHIRLLERLSRLRQKESLLKAEKSSLRKTQRLLEEISKDEEMIMYAINNPSDSIAVITGDEEEECEKEEDLEAVL